MTTCTPPGQMPPDPDLDAFLRTQPLRDAYQAKDAPRGLNRRYAIAKALQTVAACAPLRAQMDGIPGFDPSCYDVLTDLAHGLSFADGELARRVEQAKAMPALTKEGYPLRSAMLDYAVSLSNKELIDPKLIDEVREGAGNLDLASDLNTMVRAFRALPVETFGPWAPITLEDIERAQTLAREITARITEVARIGKDQKTLIVETRKQTLLLLENHDQVRRIVSFLHWGEGDVELLAPSLYVPGGRPSSSKRKGHDDAPSLAEEHEALHAATPAESPTYVDPEDNPFAPDDE